MSIAIMWFRNDLRLTDNPALMNACAHHQLVIPLYCYDEKHSILGAAQAWWLHHSLVALRTDLMQRGLHLVCQKGDPLTILLALLTEYPVSAVYWNRCYEPQAIARDKKIKATLLEKGIFVQSSNGSVFHEPWTIKNKQGDFFKVFTPYWKHCRAHLPHPVPMRLTDRPNGILIERDAIEEWALLPTAPNWAERFSACWTPGEAGALEKLTRFIHHHLRGYKNNRDFPEKNATSRLSPHLHFGEIGLPTIAHAVERARLEPDYDQAAVEHFLSELGWREFGIYLLYHVPTLPEAPFRPEFETFPWENNKELLRRWQKGLTGYPIIDAGMRELWATGYMHNRVRMIAASFLTKDLLVHWRLGADWFLDTLVDADLANNSAGWQWVAGCGADAAPYFRIFNPVLQSQRFDPTGAYIRQWVPELSALSNQAIHAPWEDASSASIYSTTTYPKPLINHANARDRALDYYTRLKKMAPI